MSTCEEQGVLSDRIGKWQKDKETGKWYIFVRGNEIPAGTIVEVEQRYGKVSYVRVQGVQSKVSGGLLYHFKHTSKPMRPITTAYHASMQGVLTECDDTDADTGGKVNLDDLDAALHLVD